MSEASDFPVMRQMMERLDEWVMALASPLLPLGEFPQELNGLKGFRWDFKEKSERALMVGKAVRMASGIRAALILADLGYITECGTILRTVSDFVIRSSRFTKAAQETIRREPRKISWNNTSPTRHTLRTNMMRSRTGTDG
jgi:hypothetical protein